MPLHGYTRMFERMLDHPNIKVMLNTDYREICDELEYDHLVYSGPVDEYFDYCYGKLPYRSLRFEHSTLDQEHFQAVATVNYSDEAVAYTRITEYKHLTDQQHRKTSITREYPSAEGDPYYPIPRAENAELYRRYERLAAETPKVTFLGRLGTYIQVLQHGSGGWPGAGLVQAHRRRRTAARRAGSLTTHAPPCSSVAGWQLSTHRCKPAARAAGCWMHTPTTFESFFMAGFECSTHRRRDGHRLDLIAATRHDRWAAKDYAALSAQGLRWHLIEQRPGHYDWSSFLPMLHAANSVGTQVIWDLCDYGWPDDVDI